MPLPAPLSCASLNLESFINHSSDAGLPRLSWKEAAKWAYVQISSVLDPQPITGGGTMYPLCHSPVSMLDSQLTEQKVGQLTSGSAVFLSNWTSRTRDTVDEDSTSLWLAVPFWQRVVLASRSALSPPPLTETIWSTASNMPCTNSQSVIYISSLSNAYDKWVSVTPIKH